MSAQQLWQPVLADFPPLPPSPTISPTISSPSTTSRKPSLKLIIPTASLPLNPPPLLTSTSSRFCNLPTRGIQRPRWVEKGVQMRIWGTEVSEDVLDEDMRELEEKLVVEIMDILEEEGVIDLLDEELEEALMGVLDEALGEVLDDELSDLEDDEEPEVWTLHKTKYVCGHEVECCWMLYRSGRELETLEPRRVCAQCESLMEAIAMRDEKEREKRRMMKQEKRCVVM